MTTTIDRATLNRILEHYRNKAMEQFPNKLFTPAVRYEIELYLRQYQEFIIKRETHPGWRLPIQLIFDPQGCNMDVELDSQADVQVV